MGVVVQVWMDVRDCKTERRELMFCRLSDRAQLIPRLGDPVQHAEVCTPCPATSGLFLNQLPKFTRGNATPQNDKKPRRSRPSPPPQTFHDWAAKRAYLHHALLTTKQKASFAFHLDALDLPCGRSDRGVAIPLFQNASMFDRAQGAAEER